MIKEDERRNMEPQDAIDFYRGVFTAEAEIMRLVAETLQKIEKGEIKCQLSWRDARGVRENASGNSAAPSTES